MFFNRKSELKQLEQVYESRATNFFIIYGRRRIGKTSFLKEFLINKNGFYFLADRLPERENLKTLSRLVRVHFRDEFLTTMEDWYTFFRFLKNRLTQKTIIIIDEFPYLVETNPAISSIFQKGWDEYLKELPIFLILCGSSMSMMYQATLDYKAPLYGRRTGQLFIKPLHFDGVSDFFPTLDFDQRLEFYTIAGGVPAYLQKLDPAISTQENMIQHVLNKTSYLYEEVNYILKEEVREPRIYFSILKAIAQGKRKFGEIINETGLQKTSLHKYLYILEELGLIEKMVSVTERDVTKSRKGRYQIVDHFFRVWFNYVFPYHSELEFENLQPSLKCFNEHFLHLCALCYEEIAMECLKKHQSELFTFFKIGKWWDRNEEIDIVAYDESQEHILFAEVKWSLKPVGTNIFQKLQEKSLKVDWPSQKKHYALISLSDFTPEMIQLAQQEKVLLISGQTKISLD